MGRVEDRSVVGPLEDVCLRPLQSHLVELHLLEIKLPHVAQVLACHRGEKRRVLTVVAADYVEFVVGLHAGLTPALLRVHAVLRSL